MAKLFQFLLLAVGVVALLAVGGEVFVPITATAPPAIPTWLGWVIGFIPLYGLLVFLLWQRGRKLRQEQTAVVA